MAGGFGGSVSLTGADEYKKSLNQITQSLKVCSAEMKATASSFDVGDKSEAELNKTSKQLDATLNEQKQALAGLKNELANMSAKYQEQGKRLQELKDKQTAEKQTLEQIGKTLGTTSKEYKEQEKVVDALSKEVLENEKAYERDGKALNDFKIKTANAETTINKTATSLKNMGREAETSGEKSKKASSNYTIMKNILANLGTQVINAVINGLKDLSRALVNSIPEVAKLGDEIGKSSQKLGLSTDTYQKLSYAMERSGTSIDTVSKGMQNITKSLANTQNGVKGASDNFDKLGVSLKNADGSMKSAEKVLTDTIGALANMKDETQRNALSNSIFGKSYQELLPLLNSGADGIEALMKEAEDYGMVMSNDAVKSSEAFLDSLTKLKGTMSGLKNNLVAQFLPSVTTIMNGFSDLVKGSDGAKDTIKKGVQELGETIKQMLPKIIEVVKGIGSVVKELMGSLLQDLINNLPSILSAGANMMSNLATGISQGLPQVLGQIPIIIGDIVGGFQNGFPQILQAGSDLLLSLGTGILDALPTILAELPTIIEGIVGTLLDSIPTIVDTGVKLLSSLVDNLPQAISNILKALPQIISSLIQKLISAIPQIAKAGFDLLVSIVKNLPAIIVEVVKAIPQIIGSIVQGFMSGVGKMAEVGFNLIKGLWEGIKNVGAWIMDKIKGFFGGIVNGIKNFFGIKSPSKVFRDQIGKNLALGIGVGFEDEMEDVTRQMQDAMPTSLDVDANVGVNGSTAGGFAYSEMFNAFMDALSQMKIELDDEVAGKFVEKTVARAIYT